MPFHLLDLFSSVADSMTDELHSIVDAVTSADHVPADLSAADVPAAAVPVEFGQQVDTTGWIEARDHTMYPTVSDFVGGTNGARK